jgi:catechol 2,3-dioxygenase-like lactoylglutathione lyase family enzyme
MTKTNGIHHITAITSDPQKNLDFYEGFLGQRLVKKTVNFDDPTAYHLYYGDAVGTPGSIMTFFYWASIPKGTRGNGEVASIYYSIKSTSRDFWKERANEFKVSYTEKVLPFGETVLMISDPDGLEIGLVASDIETNVVPWTEGTVPTEHVLGGFYGALLALAEDKPIGPTLEEGLGYSVVEKKEDITRYTATSWPGKFLATQVQADTPQARQGAGSIHHIAFQADTDDQREQLKTQVNEIGLGSTGLIDRQYFHSTYFMTPAMILFEIATNDIGFAVDEEAAELGEHLKLPSQYEAQREEISATLTPLTLPRNK